jgi:hypothetical protein
VQQKLFVTRRWSLADSFATVRWRTEARGNAQKPQLSALLPLFCALLTLARNSICGEPAAPL